MYKGNGDSYFSIDPATGKIFIIKEIDREKLLVSFFTLEIEAKQKDNPLKASTAQVSDIMKVNKIHPTFQHFVNSPFV